MKALLYLLASPLSGAEIVLGKLAARLVNLVVLVAVGLPVVSIALFLGGIDPHAVWLCYGISFSTLYLVAGISILASTFTERPRDAILRAYLIEFVWLALPLLEKLVSLSGGTLGRLAVAAYPITEWVIGSSPAILIIQDTPLLNTEAGLPVIFWLIGLQILEGTLLLAWSTLRLRPIEQGTRLWGLRRSGKHRDPSSFRLSPRRPCSDTPDGLERVQRHACRLGLGDSCAWSAWSGPPWEAWDTWFIAWASLHTKRFSTTAMEPGDAVRPRRTECDRAHSDRLSLRPHGSSGRCGSRGWNHHGTRAGCLDKPHGDAAGGWRNSHGERFWEPSGEHAACSPLCLWSGSSA